MSEEGRPNDTRAIALDLVETMAAMRESCYVLGMNPTEADAHMKEFLEGELVTLAEDYIKRVRGHTKEIPFEPSEEGELSPSEVSIYDFSMN